MKTYDYTVTKTVTYIQFVEVVDAHSEDEAYDTVMELIKDDVWDIDDVDFDVELDDVHD